MIDWQLWHKLIIVTVFFLSWKTFKLICGRFSSIESDDKSLTVIHLNNNNLTNNSIILNSTLNENSANFNFFSFRNRKRNGEEDEEENGEDVSAIELEYNEELCTFLETGNDLSFDNSINEISIFYIKRKKLFDCRSEINTKVYDFIKKGIYSIENMNLFFNSLTRLQLELLKEMKDAVETKSSNPIKSIDINQKFDSKDPFHIFWSLHSDPTFQISNEFYGAFIAYLHLLILEKNYIKGEYQETNFFPKFCTGALYEFISNENMDINNYSHFFEFHKLTLEELEYFLNVTLPYMKAVCDPFSKQERGEIPALENYDNYDNLQLLLKLHLDEPYFIDTLHPGLFKKLANVAANFEMKYILEQNKLNSINTN